jgi:hypothetical protein
LPAPVAPCRVASIKAAVVLAPPASITQTISVLGQRIYALQAVRNLLLLSSMEATLAQDGPTAFCEHTPLSLVVLRTERRDHRAHCLECGAVGPERESAAQAWRALRWLRYRDKHSLS